MELKKHGKKIADIITVVLCIIAISSFSISYYSLYQMAVNHGIHSLIAWLWPLGLDAFMIASCLAVIRFKTLKESTIYPWILVAVTTIASIGFNVASVWHTQNPLTMLIYGFPPIVVFLSLEALILVIRVEQDHMPVRKTPARKPAKKVV